MNYLSVVAGAVIGLFIFFIIRKQPLRRSDYLLMAFNSCLIFILMVNAWMRVALHPFALVLQNSLPLALYATFLWYALQRIQHPWRRWWPYFYLPFLFSTLCFAIDMWLRPQDAASLQELFKNPPLQYHFFFKGNQLLFIIALIFLLRHLRSYTDQLLDNYSNVEPLSIEWLRDFTKGLLALLLLASISFLANNAGLPLPIELIFTSVDVGILLLVFYLNVEGIRHYSIAAYEHRPEVEVPEQPLDLPEQKVAESKYERSALKSEEAQRCYEQIQAVLLEEKLYQQPKLSLQDLAARLPYSRHELSQSINEMRQQNFYDLVNGFRVQHLQGLLEKEELSYTILALGLESGFSSKASLNRIFKQKTGQTPSAYRRAWLKKDSK